MPVSSSPGDCHWDASNIVVPEPMILTSHHVRVLARVAGISLDDACDILKRMHNVQVVDDEWVVVDPIDDF